MHTEPLLSRCMCMVPLNSLGNFHISCSWTIVHDKECIPCYTCLCTLNWCSVRLSKRRTKATKSAMNSKLVVKHRELTEEEIYAQVSYVKPICLWLLNVAHAIYIVLHVWLAKKIKGTTCSIYIGGGTGTTSTAVTVPILNQVGLSHTKAGASIALSRLQPSI